MCLSSETALEAAPKPFSALFDNLRRLAGVSEAGARCRNPERSEGSQIETISGRDPPPNPRAKRKIELSHWFWKTLPASPLNSKTWREFPPNPMIPKDRGEGGYPHPY